MKIQLFIGYAAFYILFLSLLGSIVSLTRIVKKISLGDGDDKFLRNAIRAHGNAIEHVLPYLFLLFALEIQGSHPKWIHFFAISFALARLSHAFGLLRFVFLARRVGATFTVIFEVLLSIWIIFQFFVAKGWN